MLGRSMIYSPDGGRRERKNTRRLAVRDVDSCLEYSPGKKSMRHGDVLDKGERITVSGLVSKAGKLYTVEKNAIFIVGWKDQCLR